MREITDEALNAARRACRTHGLDPARSEDYAAVWALAVRDTRAALAHDTPPLGRVRVHLDGYGRKSRVHLDGHDISTSVSGVRIDARVDRITTVQLELAAADATTIDGDARVILGPGVVELLLRYGWTPPSEQAPDTLPAPPPQTPQQQGNDTAPYGDPAALRLALAERQDWA